jgi:tRNA (mo5U34)-methyltransferase
MISEQPETTASAEVAALRERIAQFPRWQYRFDFDGGVHTPVLDRARINRHEQRRRYFFDALLSLTGGSLAGRRVLDLGCNAGFWSLQAVQAGAEYVCGLDVREMHVDQANLVFGAKGIDPARYRFEVGDVFSRELGEPFDVVLCLGLMEHIAKPVELFEIMARTGAELIVIDTALCTRRWGFFEISQLHEPEEIVDRPLVLIPTREAVAELAEQFDYEAVALEQNITDYRGMDDYRAQRRLAFICARTIPLDWLAEAPWLSAAEQRLPESWRARFNGARKAVAAVTGRSRPNGASGRRA